MPRLVISSPNIRSNALLLLSRELSRRVGYTVWRVTPDRVAGRTPIIFNHGIDKISQFRAFHSAQVAAPAFATRLEEARRLPGDRVVCRATTTGSEGAGITIVEKESLNQQVPLYTQYIRKKKEFRVHVWNHEVIDVQEKRRKEGTDGDSKVRNTANGYVFCRNDVVAPTGCFDLALGAVRALGRRDGGVDIIWNKQLNQCYVLEVNSRPGMEGTTVVKYAEAIVREHS